MSSLINFSLKNADGSYTNYSMNVNDQTDKYGNNVSVILAQSKDEREAKKPKVYVGNGKVVFTDGSITKAEFVEREKTTQVFNAKDDLPF